MSDRDETHHMSELDHQQVRDLLTDYTYGDARAPMEAAARVAVESHLASCAACQREYATILRIRALMRSLAESPGAADEPTPSLADAVLARLHESNFVDEDTSPFLSTPDVPVAAWIPGERRHVMDRPSGAWSPVRTDPGGHVRNRSTTVEKTARPNARRTYPTVAAALLVVLIGVLVVTGLWHVTTAGLGSGPGISSTSTPSPSQTGPIGTLPAINNVPGTVQTVGQLVVTVNPATGLPTQGTLSAVAMVTANDGYAVGTDTAGTLIAHYDGTRWMTLHIGVPNGSLSSVAAVAANDIWAVGSVQQDALVMHYDGKAWQRIVVPFQSALQNISMISANEGWMLGQTEAHGPIVVHYLNGNWSTLNLTATSDAHALAALTPNDVWIGGYGTLLRRQNGQWSVIRNDINGNVLALTMLSPTDAWAGGLANGAQKRASGFGNGPLLMHYDGTNWTAANLSSVKTNGVIYGLSFGSSSAGWAVGLGAPTGASQAISNSFILGYANGQWSPYATQFPAVLAGVAMVSASEGWAVGSGDLPGSTTTLPIGGPVATATPSATGGSTPYVLHYQNNQWNVYAP